MEILSASSSSPSSAAASLGASLGPNYSGSSSPATACIGSIFRRFLCAGFSARANRIYEEDFGHVGGEIEGSERIGGGADVGVVARLMGLESMPAPPCSSASGSRIVARLMGLDSMPAPPCSGASGSRGSARGSQSARSPSGEQRSRAFREMPMFLREESEEFLVLSFGPDEGDDDASRLARVKCDRRGGRAAEKTTEKIGVSEKAGIGTKIGNSVEDMGEEQHSKRRVQFRSKEKKHSDCEKRSESESSSHNSSPVSVLDLPTVMENSYYFEVEASVSGAEHESLCDVSSRRNSGRKVSSSGCQLVSADEKCALWSLDQRHISSAEVWADMCEAVEAEVKGSNWVLKECRRSEQSSELAHFLGEEIFQLLVQEAVEELCSFQKLCKLATVLPVFFL